MISKDKSLPKKKQIDFVWELGKLLVAAGVGFSLLLLPLSFWIGQIVPGSLSCQIIMPFLILIGGGVIIYVLCRFKKLGTR